jgi:hypothetical protein
MALDDFVESEVAITAAAAAVVFSPRVRGVLRKGAVYGVAGLLVAGDAVGSFVRGVGRGAQNAAGGAAAATMDAAGNAASATTDAAKNAAGAVTDTTESTVNATAVGGDTTSTTPTTPEAAADELAAVAQGTTDGTTTTGRRSRRAQAEQTGDITNE